MADKDHGASLCCNNALGCGDIVGQRYRRILDDGDIVAVFLQYPIDALPTGPVHEATVDENDSHFRRIGYCSHNDFLSLDLRQAEPGAAFSDQEVYQQNGCLITWNACAVITPGPTQPPITTLNRNCYTSTQAGCCCAPRSGSPSPRAATRPRVR